MVRTTRLGHPGVGRLRAVGLVIAVGLMLLSAGVARAAEPTTYIGTETIPVPPQSNFAGSAGGDGWGVALSNTQAFNVFHHNSVLQVVAHNQSDASTAWGPDQITDGSGNDFATGGQPGLYLDQNTGKLYVYATRTSDSTGGVVCVDTTQGSTNSDPFCGFTPLTGVGEASLAPGWSELTNETLIGSHLYSFNYDPGSTSGPGSQNKVLCFDVSTDAACAGQPFTVNFAAGLMDNRSPAPGMVAVAGKLIMQVSVDGTGQLACLDDATQANCGSSWPASASGVENGSGDPFAMLDSNGDPIGVCLPSPAVPCWDLNGNSVTTPSGLPGALSSDESQPWNGPGVVVGPRVYIPAWENVVSCFDYATGASCANFPKTFNNLGGLYTVNSDPQRPTCLWVNSDDGTQQIQNFDAFSGGECGQGPVRALISQFVNSGAQCTPSSYQYLHIDSPANAQGTVSFEDSDGTPIPGDSPRQIGADGRVDLSGLALTSSSQFLIDLTNQPSAPTSEQLSLAWAAPYETTCIDDDDVVGEPAITAAGTSVSPTEGQAFTGAVASFTDPDTTAKSTDYSASINWGDGSSSVGTITGTPSKFTVSGTHTYAEEGSHTVTVSITDKDGSGNHATVSDSAKVADAPLHATAVTPTLSGAAADRVTKAAGTVATFTDSDPGGTVSDYRASINWGDGTTTSGTVSKGTGHFVVTGSHTYGKSGSHKITVTVKDIGGSTATAVTGAVKAAAVARASASLSGVSAACVRGAVDAQVRGTRIASVRFTLDGRRMPTRTVRRGRHYAATFTVSNGGHRLAVTVRFKKSSRPAARRFARTVSACSLPTFTG